MLSVKIRKMETNPSGNSLGLVPISVKVEPLRGRRVGLSAAALGAWGPICLFL